MIGGFLKCDTTKSQIAQAEELFYKLTHMNKCKLKWLKVAPEIG